MGLVGCPAEGGLEVPLRLGSGELLAAGDPLSCSSCTPAALIFGQYDAWLLCVLAGSETQAGKLNCKHVVKSHSELMSHAIWIYLLGHRQHNQQLELGNLLLQLS